MFLFFIFNVFLLQRTGSAWGQGEGLAPVGWGRWQGKEWEDEYGANNVYTYM
jgi:hypothetical protein